jgi:hypothetical protein
MLTCPFERSTIFSQFWRKMMTRYHKFEELKQSLKLHCFYGAAGSMHLMFSAFSCIAFLALAINNIINQSRPDMLFSMVTIIVSFSFFVANVWVWQRARVKEEEVGAKLSKEWLTFYSGSMWKTYAGEIGEVVGVAPTGARFNLRFKDGTEQSYPVATIQSAHADSPHSDTSGLNKDGLVKFRMVEGREVAFLLAALISMPLLLWLVAISGGRGIVPMHEWAAFPLFGILEAWVLGCIMLLVKAPDVEFNQSHLEYAKLVSASTWKTLDGRTGVVRWASPAETTSEGRTVKAEKIKLAFGNGQVQTFQRSYVHPTAFGCMKEN